MNNHQRHLLEALDFEKDGKRWWTFYDSKLIALESIRKIWHSTALVPSEYLTILSNIDERLSKTNLNFAWTVQVLREKLVKEI